MFEIQNIWTCFFIAKKILVFELPTTFVVYKKFVYFCSVQKHHFPLQ